MKNVVPEKLKKFEVLDDFDAIMSDFDTLKKKYEKEQEDGKSFKNLVGLATMRISCKYQGLFELSTKQGKIKPVVGELAEPGDPEALEEPNFLDNFFFKYEKV